MPRTTQNMKRNAEIVRRRLAGEWPTEIAAAMGLSRNVVIGVTNRAGLARPDVDRSAIMRSFGPKGERHGTAKLTESAVRLIRARYEPYSRSNGARAIARALGLAYPTVRNVTSGRAWGHVQ